MKDRHDVWQVVAKEDVFEAPVMWKLDPEEWYRDFDETGLGVYIKRDPVNFERSDVNHLPTETVSRRSVDIKETYVSADGDSVTCFS